MRRTTGPPVGREGSGDPDHWSSGPGRVLRQLMSPARPAATTSRPSPTVPSSPNIRSFFHERHSSRTDCFDSIFPEVATCPVGLVLGQRIVLGPESVYVPLERAIVLETVGGQLAGWPSFSFLTAGVLTTRARGIPLRCARTAEYQTARRPGDAHPGQCRALGVTAGW